MTLEAQTDMAAAYARYEVEQFGRSGKPAYPPRSANRQASTAADNKDKPLEAPKFDMARAILGAGKKASGERSGAARRTVL